MSKSVLKFLEMTKKKSKLFQKAFKNGKKCSNVGKRVQKCAYVIYEWPLRNDEER